MSAPVLRYDEVAVGTALPWHTATVTRAQLIAYAGASGDVNPIHWSDRKAAEIGLPGVIAHGALVMALAASLLTEWAGDAAAVVDYGVRFARPVVVPDDDIGTQVTVGGSVAAKLALHRVRVDLLVRWNEAKVLTRSRAVVQLDPPTPTAAPTSSEE